MTKRKVCPDCKFHYYRILSWGLMLGRGYITHNSEYPLFSTLSNIHHIDCYCIKGI